MDKTLRLKSMVSEKKMVRKKIYGEFLWIVLLWTPSHGRAEAGRPARTYVQQLCTDTGCSPEDLPEAMDDRGSGISVLMARHDDDDDFTEFYLYIDIVLIVCIFFAKILFLRLIWEDSKKEFLHDPIYPTPPLGQDMTQGQFLSGV